MSDVINDILEMINIFHICTYKSLGSLVPKHFKLYLFLIIKLMDCIKELFDTFSNILNIEPQTGKLVLHLNKTIQ